MTLKRTSTHARTLLNRAKRKNRIILPENIFQLLKQQLRSSLNHRKSPNQMSQHKINMIPMKDRIQTSLLYNRRLTYRHTLCRDLCKYSPTRKVSWNNRWIGVDVAKPRRTTSARQRCWSMYDWLTLVRQKDRSISLPHLHNIFQTIQGCSWSTSAEQQRDSSTARCQHLSAARSHNISRDHDDPTTLQHTDHTTAWYDDPTTSRPSDHTTSRTHNLSNISPPHPSAALHHGPDAARAHDSTTEPHHGPTTPKWQRSGHGVLIRRRQECEEELTSPKRRIGRSWRPNWLEEIKVAVLVLLLCSAATVRGSSDRLADGALEFEDILPTNPRGYDKMAPPREVDKQPTIVYFHVTVMSLDSIDESSMTYAADIFFAQSWKDWRLRLPDNMTQQYRLLPVQWLKDIWRPDSFFKNAKDVTFQEMTIPNHYIWLYQDKTILYMVKLTLVLSCAMNFEVYPHDTQECTMKIESLSHTTADLVFVWDPDVPLVVDQSIELPQLDLVRNVTGDCTQVYSTGNFTCLEVIFTFRRRLGYYLFHTYIPTCLIVIMSWISFWIRPEAVPARITLGVTSLLTLATQHANSQKSLPPVSYIKAIDVFMSSCMVFVFFSLMEYALVNVVLGDVPEEGRMPIICRTRRTNGNQAEESGLKNQRMSVPTHCGEHLGPCRNSTSYGCIGPGNNPPHGMVLGLPPPPPPAHLSSDGHDKHTQYDTEHETNNQHYEHPQQEEQQQLPLWSQVMERRRQRAILIDRVSRVFFPVSFTVLNIVYWGVFVIDWPPWEDDPIS